MRPPRHNEVTRVSKDTYMVFQEDPAGRRALRFIKALPDGTEVTGFTLRDDQLFTLKRLCRWTQFVIESNTIQADARLALENIKPDPVLLELLAKIDAGDPVDG